MFVSDATRGAFARAAACRAGTRPLSGTSAAAGQLKTRRPPASAVPTFGVVSLFRDL